MPGEFPKAKAEAAEALRTPSKWPPGCSCHSSILRMLDTCPTACAKLESHRSKAPHAKTLSLGENGRNGSKASPPLGPLLE